MKLYTVKMYGKELPAVGNADGTKVKPICELGLSYEDMTALIGGMTADEKAMLEKAAAEEKDFYPIADVQILAPIPRPRQDVICLGINYMNHAEEASRYKQEAFGGERPYPIYFSKRVNEAVADGGIIPAHEDLVDSLDYESELAVVIGKDCLNVAEKDVFDYLFGYTVLNDVSARNVQTQHKQWYFGKSLDGFTPMGPCIVTADTIEWPPKLQVKSYVNGEPRQNSNTELLIFDIAHCVSELSQGMLLQAGTIIATGTPAGVGMGFQPPKFLKKGDVVTCEIERIGKITNTIG